MSETTRIVSAGSDRDAYLPLLLLADDSESEVRAYYQKGDLYSFDDRDHRPLGVTLVVPRGDGSVELKAVAVDADRHGEGIGRRMLAAVLADLGARGVAHVVVGTANSGVGELASIRSADFASGRSNATSSTPPAATPKGWRRTASR